jgi:hypothetical protein
MHRARVMDVLRSARGEFGKTLCVLGPGNGNDIELGQLARDFEKVALVDLDDAAVARAVSRLSVEEVQRTERHCPVDLSGVLRELESWRARKRRTDAEISAVKQLVVAAPRPEIGEFDVVASTCILTQLIDAVYMAMPPKHSRRDELLFAVRNRHLDMILEMLKPGGVGVLLTDFAVAGATNNLAPLSELALPSSTQVGMRRSEFFTGTDPFEIRDFYKRTRGPGPTAEDVAIEGPWCWEVGGRVLAVCAVVFRAKTLA